MSAKLWNPNVSRLGFTKENMEQRKDLMKSRALLERELSSQITDTRLGEQLELERRRLDFEPLAQSVQQLTEATALKITPKKLADEYVRLIAEAAKEGKDTPKFKEVLQAVTEDMKNRVANNDLMPEDVPAITAAISSASALAGPAGNWIYSFNGAVSVDRDTGDVFVGDPGVVANKADIKLVGVDPDTNDHIFEYMGVFGPEQLTISGPGIAKLFGSTRMSKPRPAGVKNADILNFNEIINKSTVGDEDFTSFMMPVKVGKTAKTTPDKVSSLLDTTRKFFSAKSVAPGVSVDLKNGGLSLLITNPSATRGKKKILKTIEIIEPGKATEADILTTKYALVGNIFPEFMKPPAEKLYGDLVKDMDAKTVKKKVRSALTALSMETKPDGNPLIDAARLNEISAMAQYFLKDKAAGGVNSADAKAVAADFKSGKKIVVGSGFRMFNASKEGLSAAKVAKQGGAASPLFNEISKQLDEMNVPKKQKMAILRKAMRV